MIRKLLAVVAAFLLLCGAAGAEGLTRAMPRLNLHEYLDSPGFAIDEASGDFTLTGLSTRALLRAIERGELNSASSTGISVLYLRIEGNAKTGMYAPVLSIAYASPRALNATALSLRAGDMRYDFALTREEGASGVELYTAMLDREGVAALSDVKNAGTATLRLHGDRTYTTELKDEESGDAKTRLQNHSFACIGLSAELEVLGFSEYLFEDENAEAWLIRTGDRPQFQKTDLAAEEGPSGKGIPALDKAMRMLSADGDSANVKLLKEKLYEMRMLTSVSATSYDLSVKRAIEDLQASYGMVRTGSADGALLRRLYGEVEMPADEPENGGKLTNAAPGAEISAQAGEAYAIEGTIELTLNRYWTAGRLKTSRPSSALSYQDVLNTDHILLIADGEIVNLMAEEMSFGRVLSASYVLNGKHSYPATIKCESDGGERMDSSLLALGKSRVFVVAEAPSSVLDANGTWTLVIECEGRKINYTLS